MSNVRLATKKWYTMCGLASWKCVFVNLEALLTQFMVKVHVEARRPIHPIAEQELRKIQFSEQVLLERNIAGGALAQTFLKLKDQ